MQALVVKDGELTFEADFPEPKVEDGYARIRLLVAGICSTDLEIVKGYAGFQGVLGHEFVGIIEAAPDKSWIGRRVVGNINIGCGVCPICTSNGPEHCPQRTVLGIIGHNGAFADYLTLPMRNLIAVPDTLADEVAVFTEPLAAALRIREQVIVAPSAEMAVVGPGRLGMLIAQVLALGGSGVTVLGRSFESLDLAKSMGIPNGLASDFADDSFDLVVEATGNAAGLSQSLRLVRPLGTLVLKSTFSGRAEVDLTKLVVAEINVVGSRCGPFEPALRILDRGSVQVAPLVDGEFYLSEGLKAFGYASRSGIRKVLLRP